MAYDWLLNALNTLGDLLVPTIKILLLSVADLLDLLVLLIKIAALVVAALLALMTLAACRNGGVFPLHCFMEMIKVAVEVIGRALYPVPAKMSSMIDSATAGLAYGGGPQRAANAGWIGWDLLGPLLYLLAFVLLGSGDLNFLILGFGALLGRPVSALPFPIGLEVAAGLVFFVLGVVYGMVLFDLFGGPMQRPWSTFGNVVQRALKFVCAGALVATCVAAVAFAVWRQLQLPPIWADPSTYLPPEPWNTDLPILIWGLLSSLLVIASAMTGWATIASFAGLFVLAMFTLRIFVEIALKFIVLPLELIVHLDLLVIAVIDMPCGWGLAMWNWIRVHPKMKSFDLPVLVHVPVSRLTYDITRPLW